MLAVWRDPMAHDDGRWVRLGVGIFLLEFILLQASLAIGGASMDTSAGDMSFLGIAMLIVFFAAFAAAIAWGFKSRMLFMAFLSLVIGRLIGLLFGMSTDDKALLLAHSLVAMGLYFVLVFASVILPWPRLGITREIADATRDPQASGQWVREPHRAIGAATVYYLLLGVLEVTVMTWIDPHLITFR
jgi:hypothetical protein